MTKSSQKYPPQFPTLHHKVSYKTLFVIPVQYLYIQNLLRRLLLNSRTRSLWREVLPWVKFSVID